MGHPILHHEGQFLIYSTIIDSPITFGMTEPELVEHLREESGSNGVQNLPDRIARAKAKGASGFFDSFEGILRTNRAGKGQTRLTREQFIKAYFIDKDETLIPVGTDPNVEVE